MAPAINKPINVLKPFRTNILEDDKDDRGFMAEAFATYGLPNVHFYEDTDTFLHETDENVHLAILDQNLPGTLTGIQVAELLMSRFPKMRIVFITGHASPEFMEKLIDLQVHGFVNKSRPNYANKLVWVIKKQIEIVRSNLEYAVFLETEIK